MVCLNMMNVLDMFHLLLWGGKESVENIKKAKIKEHISLISNFIGEI